MSGNNPTANSLSGLQVPPPQVKVSFKNTFINVDDENSGELSMPDLLRAQTTPAVFNALQALYSGTQQQSTVSSGVAWSMEPVAEQESVLHESEQEEAPPQFTAEDVLRQLSELTETLSAMNHDGHSVERDTPLGDPNGDSTTVMLRNIPNKYTTDMLLDQFKEHGFSRLEFDFMYNPIDFKNQCNVGFCFVNFRHHDRAVKFIEALKITDCQPPTAIKYALCVGLEFREGRLTWLTTRTHLSHRSTGLGSSTRLVSANLSQSPIQRFSQRLKNLHRKLFEQPTRLRVPTRTKYSLVDSIRRQEERSWSVTSRDSGQ